MQEGGGMDMRIEMDDDIAVLIPAGNLVASVTDSFNAQLEKLGVNEFRFVILDMSRINFMDSSGLDAVMSIKKRAISRGGIFVCAALQDNVQKLFRITWADQKIPVAATRLEGLQMVKGLRTDQG